MLQHRESHRDSTSRPWNFLEAEYPLDTRVIPVELLNDSAVSTLPKLGNSMMREERDDSNWKKGNFLRVENSFANSTKMDFMRR